MLAPNRPDWRWVITTELLEYTDMQAIPRLKNEDAMTKRLFKYRRAESRNMGFEYKDMCAATEIYQTRPHERMIIEALVLAGADNEKVLEYVELSDSDLEAYLSTFFDVRNRRPGTVCSMLFQGMPHRGTHVHDQLGIMHRLAWFGKLPVIEKVLGQGLMGPEVQGTLRTILNDTLLKNSVETAMTIGTRSDIAAEILKITLDSTASDKSEEGSSNEYGQAVRSFMDKAGLTVADPSENHNLLSVTPTKTVEAEVIHVA
jgi:hypothetical protein